MDVQCVYNSRVVFFLTLPIYSTVIATYATQVCAVACLSKDIHSYISLLYTFIIKIIDYAASLNSLANTIIMMPWLR